jgi:hypothetical protein
MGKKQGLTRSAASIENKNQGASPGSVPVRSSQILRETLRWGQKRTFHTGLRLNRMRQQNISGIYLSAVVRKIPDILFGQRFAPHGPMGYAPC